MSLHFLVSFPCSDQARSAVIAQIDRTSGHPHETVRSYLPPANQGHHEPIRQRPQFFRKIQGKRWPAGTRAMEEPHLVIQPDAFQGTDELRYQQPVAKSEHGVDWITRRSLAARREPEIALRQGSTDRTEVGSGRIAFHSSNMVCCVSTGQTRNSRRNLCGPFCEKAGLCRFLLIPRPSVHHLPAVLKFRRYDRPGQRQRMIGVGDGLIQGSSQVYVSAGRVADYEPHRTAHLQRCDANAASDARFQRLSRDLAAAQHDDRVDRFQRDSLASVRGRYQQ